MSVKSLFFTHFIYFCLFFTAVRATRCWWETSGGTKSGWWCTTCGCCSWRGWRLTGQVETRYVFLMWNDHYLEHSSKSTIN